MKRMMSERLMSERVMPLRQKIILPVVGVFWIVLFILAVVICFDIEAYLDEVLSSSYKNIVETSTYLLEESEVFYISDENKNARDVIRGSIVRKLNQVKDNINGVINVYILTQENNKVKYMFLTSNLENSNLRTGSYGEMTPALEGIFANKVGVDLEKRVVAGLKVKSAYSAIKDKEGKTIAVLGVDFSTTSEMDVLFSCLTNYLIISVLFIVVVMILIAIILKIVFNPFDVLMDKIADLSKNGGDLTKDVVLNKSAIDKFKDETDIMTDLVNKMRNHIKDIITNVIYETLKLEKMYKEVSNQSDTLANTVKDVNNIVKQLALSMDDSASQSMVISEKVYDLNQAISKIDENNVNISEGLIKSGVEQEQGNKAISEALRNIEILGTTSEKITTSVKNLNEGLNKIRKIIDIIKGISDETHLLSLNATIEAARVGDAGRGFAVVASEIRNLADETKDTIRQVEAMINEIQERANDVTNAIQEGIEVVTRSSRSIREFGEIYNRLMDVIENNKVLIQKTIDSTKDITKFSDEILNAVQSIAAVTEQNSSATQELFSLTEEQLNILNNVQASEKSLKESLDKILKEVGKFKVVS